MSGVVLTNDGRASSSAERSVNSLAAPADPEQSARFVHAPPAAEPMELEKFIVDVLRRAHQTAQAVPAPDEARGIVQVAQLFADELVNAHPRFDRVRFIAAVIECDT